MGSRADIEAGQAFVLFGIKDTTPKGWFNQVAAKFHRLATKMNAIGRKMAIGSLIAATPLIAAVRIYANYSKQLAFVSTMLDGNLGRMKAFSAGIRRLSVDFGESTESLTRGLYDILSAGFAPAQAMEMLAVTTKAAKAGMTDAKNSTQAIIAVLNSYSLGAEHAQEVSDSLFTTVKKGVLTFGELAGHIGLVSSTAAAAGVTMDEMGAVLAIITRGGVETAHAVVALNNILKAFLAPTGAGAEFAKQLAGMGIGPVSLGGIKDKGFLNIMKEIAALPADMIARLFPTLRSLRGIMALKANLANIDEIYSAWLNKAGATDEAMKKIAGSFGFLIDQIKEAGVLILSYMGETLAENMKNVATYVLTIAKGFGVWVKQNKDVVVAVTKSIILFGKLGLQLMVVAKVLAVVGTIVSIFTGGWVKLVASIGAAVAALAIMNSITSSIGKTMKDISDSASRVSSGDVSGGTKTSDQFGPGPYKMVGGEYVPLKEGEEVNPNDWPATTREQLQALTRRRLEESQERAKKLNLDLTTPKGVLDPENMYDTLDAAKNRVKGLNATIVDLREELADVPNIAKRAARELEEFNKDRDEAMSSLGYGKIKKLRGKMKVQYGLDSIIGWRKTLEKNLGRALDMEGARKVILQDVIKLKNTEVAQQKSLASAAKYAIKIEEDKLKLMKQSSSLARNIGFFSGYYHTPVLTFSSTIKVTPELSALQGIEKNTASLRPDSPSHTKFVESLGKAVAGEVTK